MLLAKLKITLIKLILMCKSASICTKGESQAGSTLANVNNLEPGGTWEFKAMVTDDDFTSYKIVDVTGF